LKNGNLQTSQIFVLATTVDCNGIFVSG